MQASGSAAGCDAGDDWAVVRQWRWRAEAVGFEQPQKVLTVASGGYLPGGRAFSGSVDTSNAPFVLTRTCFHSSGLRCRIHGPLFRLYAQLVSSTLNALRSPKESPAKGQVHWKDRRALLEDLLACG